MAPGAKGKSRTEPSKLQDTNPSSHTATPVTAGALLPLLPGRPPPGEPSTACTSRPSAAFHTRIAPSPPPDTTRLRPPPHTGPAPAPRLPGPGSSAARVHTLPRAAFTDQSTRAPPLLLLLLAPPAAPLAAAPPVPLLPEDEIIRRSVHERAPSESAAASSQPPGSMQSAVTGAEWWPSRPMQLLAAGSRGRREGGWQGQTTFGRDMATPN